MGRNGKEPVAKWKAICILLLAVVVMAGLYRGGRWLEERSRNPEPRGNYQDRKASDTTVTYNGTVYRQRNGLTSILLMGVDRDSGEAARVCARHSFRFPTALATERRKAAS